MSGWVTVTGPPVLICCRNNDTTGPEAPSTLPDRTMVKREELWRLASPSRASSAMRWEAPIMFVGRTALSVEISTKDSTPARMAASAQYQVPYTLLRTPSTTLCSTRGTCLEAAAWYTVWTPNERITF